MRGTARAAITLVSLMISGCADMGADTYADQGSYGAPAYYGGQGGYYPGAYAPGPPVYGAPGYYETAPPGWYGRNRDFHERREFQERREGRGRDEGRRGFEQRHEEMARPMPAQRPTMAPPAPPQRATVQPPAAAQNQRRLDQLGFRPSQ